MNINLLVSSVLVLLPSTVKQGEVKVNKATITPTSEVVTVTTYTPSVEECDSTPHITASGFKIDTLNPKRHKIIAVSRDLKRKWKFGTKIRITGIGKYSGTYIVKDVMNKRYRKRIDILLGKQNKQFKFTRIKIYKIN
jgi:3D (Asp-Asp-Asp) domain-containing protein